MPVSTRSQLSYQEENDSNTAQRTRNRPRSDLEEEVTHTNLPLRNPHNGLKEKMRALTMLYEQQKRASLALRNRSPKQDEKRFSTHPSVELLQSSGKNEDKENKKDSQVLHKMVMKDTSNSTMPNSTITRTYVLPEPPLDDFKENIVMGQGRILGFASCPKMPNAVARKLSMGGQQIEVKEMDKTEVGSRILVFVRLRPMSKKEKEAGSRCCVRIVNRRDVYLTEFGNEHDYLRLKRLRGRHFTFDSSFPDSATQQEVYSTTTSELVEAVLQGRNGSVFCYGATGAGKTYTMLGTVENPGVMVLAIKDLFAKLRQRSFDGNHIVHLSYLEVYNETVRDLLSPGRPLVLREDKQGIVAAGITQYRAYSTDEVMALLQRGNQNRTTEPTRANETSSRSHAILQVVVEYKVKDALMNIVNKVGKLSLIDLAGSERALATDQRTARSIEGANINRSLLALSSCINALVEGKKHIPYRNSKLTQLLKDSLGGTCNTVMIANISPCNLSFGETQNTLHWADRAKQIRTKACEPNEEIYEPPEPGPDQTKLLLELQKENRELRVTMARQQQKLLALQAESLAANTSPTPPSASDLITPPSTINEKRKTRSYFISGNCFTPESKRKEAQGVNKLYSTVKKLKAEIEMMRKDHALQLKQKDDIIRELKRKNGRQLEDGVATEGKNKVVGVLTRRGSLRPKEQPMGELKSPSSRFKSPSTTAKKRSFWDITTANSPSVATLNGRKTRSHVAHEAAAAPSMLLQPGFARQKA